jgi:hypothetical protein
MREGARAEEIGADKSTPLGSERERGEESGLEKALTGGDCVLGERWRAGEAGPRWAYWAEMWFSIFLKFLMAFLFYFL